MRIALAVLLGRAARWLARLRGGGSAVPGRVALAIAPRLLEDSLSQLRLGLVFVSGSNGKSTTTNMLVSVLRAHGVKVFSNPSGGNLPQGIASALLASLSLTGKLGADLAVLEVDEAYGVALANRLKPSHVLLLNLQVDQLNRFHEPERVYGMLRSIALCARAGVVANASDENLMALGAEVDTAGVPVSYFAVAPELLVDSRHGLASAQRVSGADGPVAAPVVATVEALDGTSTVIAVGSDRQGVALPARGLHYAVDAAGAIAMAAELLGARFSLRTAAGAMASLGAVYGRGELLDARGEPMEIIMMKNPPSLQLNLDYLERVPEQLFMAVDGGTPDPSWFYDTDLSMIDHVDVLSGTKAWQLATRLGYADVPVGRVVPALRPALDAFLALPAPTSGTKVAVVNYEQMMEIRRLLGYLELEGGG